MLGGPCKTAEEGNEGAPFLDDPFFDLVILPADEYKVLLFLGSNGK